jgi:hypothetical protein
MRQDTERIIISEARKYLRTKGLNESDVTPEEQRELLLRLIEASPGPWSEAGRLLTTSR